MQTGMLKMRDWKMEHQTAMVENAGLENAGNDIVWNTVFPYFCSVVRRRVQYVAHPNLYTFLGHLQRATADSETDIA